MFNRNRPADVQAYPINGDGAANYGGAQAIVLTEKGVKSGGDAAEATSLANSAAAPAQAALDDLEQLVDATPIAHVRDWVFDKVKDATRLIMIVRIVEMLNGVLAGYEIVGGISLQEGPLAVFLKLLTIAAMGGLLGFSASVLAEQLAVFLGTWWAQTRGRTVEATKELTKSAKRMVAVLAGLTAAALTAAFFGQGAVRSMALSTGTQDISGTAMAAVALGLPVAVGLYLANLYAFPAAVRIDHALRAAITAYNEWAPLHAIASKLIVMDQRRYLNPVVSTTVVAEHNPVHEQNSAPAETAAIADAVNNVKIAGIQAKLDLPEKLIRIEWPRLRYADGTKAAEQLQFPGLKAA